MVKAVRNDEHRMHAFLRLRWAIFWPLRTVAWNGDELRVSAGVSREHAPESDELEELFRAYYAAVFNPARTNVELFARHVRDADGTGLDP